MGARSSVERRALMQQLPLMGAEVRPISTAFASVSQELSSAVNSLGDIPFETVGTPGCDPAVSAGLRDLRRALARLQATAEECVSVLARHNIPAGDDDQAVARAQVT